MDRFSFNSIIVKVWMGIAVWITLYGFTESLPSKLFFAVTIPPSQLDALTTERDLVEK